MRLIKALGARVCGALLVGCMSADLLIRDVTVHSGAPLLEADPRIDVTNVRKLRGVYIAGKKRS